MSLAFIFLFISKLGAASVRIYCMLARAFLRDLCCESRDCTFGVLHCIPTRKESSGESVLTDLEVAIYE